MKNNMFEICMRFILILVGCTYFSNLWLVIIFLFFHEVAHYMTGKILGYSFKSASLLPFGVRFGFKEEFINPWDDLLISISGPLINFLFFILFLILNEYSSVFELPKYINLVLCIFNLLPAAFLDGGRIFKTIISINISFYISCILVNINGIILGCSIVLLTFLSGVMIRKVPLLLMGIFFLYKSILNLRKSTINVINDILLKQNITRNNRRYIIMSKSYSPKSKILDIIKNFSFKKYYVIYIMENGSLRYNINESELFRLYFTCGNILLEECTYYLNIQEDENG